MTASSLPEDRRAAADAGMSSYLLKPVRIADLEEILDAVPVVGAPVEDAATRMVEAIHPTGGARASAAEVTEEVPAEVQVEEGPPPALDLAVLRRLTVD